MFDSTVVTCLLSRSLDVIEVADKRSRSCEQGRDVIPSTTQTFLEPFTTFQTQQTIFEIAIV